MGRSLDRCCHCLVLLLSGISSTFLTVTCVAVGECERRSSTTKYIWLRQNIYDSHGSWYSPAALTGLGRMPLSRPGDISWLRAVRRLVQNRVPQGWKEYCEHLKNRAVNIQTIRVKRKRTCPTDGNLTAQVRGVKDRQSV